MTTQYPKNNHTREGIITNMCYTYDHAWGAPFQTWEEFFGQPMVDTENGTDGVGYTEEQRKALWDRMAQIFDNDIAPFMTFKHQTKGPRTPVGGEENPLI